MSDPQEMTDRQETADSQGWLMATLTRDSESPYATLPVAGWTLALSALGGAALLAFRPGFAVPLVAAGGWAALNWILLALLIRTLFQGPQDGDTCEKSHKRPPKAFTFVLVIAKLVSFLLLVWLFASFSGKIAGVLAGLTAPLAALLARAVMKVARSDRTNKT